MMKNGSRVPGNKGHVYFFDGYKYPSVTTIIHKVVPEAPELTRWKDTFRSKEFKNSTEYRDYSSFRGTFIHYTVLNQIAPFPLDPGDLPALSDWHQWRERMVEDITSAKELWDEIDIEVIPPVFIETPLCHHGLWYAGTPDLVARIKYEGKTEFTLIDLKTSRKPYESHYHQLGAYAQMIDSGNKHRVERGLLIYLNPKSNEPDIVSLEKDEIKEQALIFNEFRNDFYAIDGIESEYGLLIPR